MNITTLRVQVTSVRDRKDPTRSNTGPRGRAMLRHFHCVVSCCYADDISSRDASVWAGNTLWSQRHVLGAQISTRVQGNKSDASRTTVITLEMVRSEHTSVCIHLRVELKAIAHWVVGNASSVRATIANLYTVGFLNSRNGLSHF